jgi:hypothetical protein
VGARGHHVVGKFFAHSFSGHVPVEGPEEVRATTEDMMTLAAPSTKGTRASPKRESESVTTRTTSLGTQEAARHDRAHDRHSGDAGAGELGLKVEINRTDTAAHGCAWGAYTVIALSAHMQLCSAI